MTDKIVYYADETKKNIDQWAETTLTPDEFLNFQESKQRNDALWNSFIDRIDPLYETVYSSILNSNITARVGFTLVLKNGITREYTDTNGILPEWDYWRKRYTAEA